MHGVQLTGQGDLDPHVCNSNSKPIKAYRWNYSILLHQHVYVQLIGNGCALLRTEWRGMWRQQR